MLRTAARHYRESSLLALRAASEARAALSRGIPAVATVVATHQMAQARLSETSVGLMLSEQNIDAPAAGSLALASFTTQPTTFAAMADTATNLDRLVTSLVQDAGRSAESVATAARPRVGHTRYLSPPSCSRCAVLAGRFYRYSDGFKRHPGCDCVMVPTTQDAAPDLISDPTDLLDKGLVTGLSKADMRAVKEDGADLGKVVNVRRYQSGLRESGRALSRAGKLTPEGIYRVASTREEAVNLLRRYGYLR